MDEFKSDSYLKEENLVYRLQKNFGVEDGVHFLLDNDLSCKCHFKDGNIILTEKDSDKIIEDENLRNKVFYGLATGRIKPIIRRSNSILPNGSRYYYLKNTTVRNSISLNDQYITAIDYRLSVWRYRELS